MPKNPSFTGSQYEEYLGEYKDEFTKVLSTLETVNFPQRILDKDYTLWSSSPDEIVNRLGWLDLPKTILKEVDNLKEFSDQIIDNGFESVVLLGMGGSSLAPEMLADSFKGLNNLKFYILDSTDPKYILSVRNQLDLESTLIIVSSKSGSTVETASLMNYFFGEYSRTVNKDDIGSHFIAITDPGSNLEVISRKFKFRNVFINNPNIGGRFSALSFFGLVPASLTGFDIRKFIERAESSALLCNKNDISTNTGLRLGAIMGLLAEKGIDKLIILTSNEISGLSSWIEQLVAESTGKSGKGILPVPAENFDNNPDCGKDRYFVYIRIKGDESTEDEIKGLMNSGLPFIIMDIEDPYDLAGQIYLWEFATAVAGYFLNVNPFDQPDVESAKVFTRDFVQKYKETGMLEKEGPNFIYENIKFFSDPQIPDIKAFLSWIKEKVVDGSYISIQAFLTPDKETGLNISGLAKKLASEFNLPVTTGFGPRYLHSSGQLHKGDSGKGIFIQLTADITDDIEIPDEPLSESSALRFGILKNAQALGDYRALRDKGRNIVSINLGPDVNYDLKKLINLI